MLTDSQTDLLLMTQEGLLTRLGELPIHVICLDRDQPLWSEQAVNVPEYKYEPESLACVLYTSGSPPFPRG